MEFETLEGSQVMDILEYGEMKNPPAKVTPPPMPSEVEEQGIPARPAEPRHCGKNAFSAFCEERACYIIEGRST